MRVLVGGCTRALSLFLSLLVPCSTLMVCPLRCQRARYNTHAPKEFGVGRLPQRSLARMTIQRYGDAARIANPGAVCGAEQACGVELVEETTGV